MICKYTKRKKRIALELFHCDYTGQMLSNKIIKTKRPYPIRLVHLATGNRRLVLFFEFLVTVFYKKHRRTTDVVVMLYAMLSSILYAADRICDKSISGNRYVGQRVGKQGE